MTKTLCHETHKENNPIMHHVPPQWATP